MTVLDMKRPFTVPAHIGRMRLHVVTDYTQAQGIVGAYMHRSPAPYGLRFAGGCKGMNADEQEAMLRYFVEELNGFRGVLSSGGTRAVTADNLINPMVTDVPAAVVGAYPDDVLNISTVPLTGDGMTLADESRLELDWQSGIAPNPGCHMLIVFQHETAGEALGWDGDLPGYANLFNLYVRVGGWQFGTVVWNGGDITRDESILVASMGWPVFVVKGSKRAADEMAAELEAGNLRKSDGTFVPELVQQRFVVVNHDQPGALRTQLRVAGFIR